MTVEALARQLWTFVGGSIVVAEIAGRAGGVGRRRLEA